MKHWILTRKRDNYKAAWTTKPMSKDNFLSSIRAACRLAHFEFVLGDYTLESV